MTPLISLCHSTARLPRGWIPACEDWMKKADNPTRVEYVLAVDKDRILELSFPPKAPVYDIDKSAARLTLNYGRKCAVDGWNAAAKASRGQLLISVADDWFPPEHWDTELLKCVPSLQGEYVLDVDNGENSFPLLPFSLLTRRYYDRLIRDYGYAGFFYPEYFGMMADCEFTDLARRDGVVINARHLKFKHEAPAKDSPAWKADATYQWQQRREAVETGNRVYIRRVKELGITRPRFVPSEVSA
jgi:hypothetical protein